uniref:Uncharacterized protein n=1 Tax=Fervidicoccus fontis TaxID=683846 RepID=A0A7J3ZK65_9CREN
MLEMRSKIIYEDEEVIVEMGPHDDEIPELIMRLFKEGMKPLTWQRLREHFSALIGEDRLRRALRHLVNTGQLVQLNRNTYADPDTLTPEILEEIELKRSIMGGHGLYRRRVQTLRRELKSSTF